ncbi:DUF397 domain-containing protein [Embleya sp. AB8]|uniref:DUF397 domain-containing protein n=1 Tax=Embleya sp. AB8 TaxID=3156304 RepID=UPI003C77932E
MVGTGRWQKSSHSGTEDCVQVADRSDDRARVGVRDSKVRVAGPVITFDAEAWVAFVGVTR